MNKTIRLQDTINHSDGIIEGGKIRVLPRTKISCGYDPYIDSVTGCTKLGEVLYERENQIMLNGAIFLLEKLFKVPAPFQTRTLNEIMNVNTTPASGNPVYPDGRQVCVFGVGIGGSGEGLNTIKPVKFYEDSIEDMVPFRVVDTPLVGAEKNKYGFVKDLVDQGNKKAYYLKAFSGNPVMKVLWKNGADGEDGTPITSSPYAGGQNTDIETFVEMVLQIEKKDIREWFQLGGNVDVTRINTLGLFSAIKEGEDYKDVRLFSKLNIDNEVLKKLKTLTFVYRIYAS